MADLMKSRYWDDDDLMATRRGDLTTTRRDDLTTTRCAGFGDLYNTLRDTGEICKMIRKLESDKRHHNRNPQQQDVVTSTASAGPKSAMKPLVHDAPVVSLANGKTAQFLSSDHPTGVLTKVLTIERDNKGKRIPPRGGREKRLAYIATEVGSFELCDE